MTERHDLDPYGRELEKQRALAEWKAQKKAQAEQQEREQKQARLQAYLKRRGEAYLDHTGSLPPQHILEGWQMDYLSEVEAAEQRKREAKLAAAEQENYNF
jgi:hypothetical protein